MNKDSDKTNICKGCGTCCQKGGPALHEEDALLVKQGIIGLEHLVTFRQGELAWHQQKECLEPLTAEMVKIRPQSTGNTQINWYKPDWTCCFLQQKRCTIHGQKPLECVALDCLDGTALWKTSALPRLTRSEVLQALAVLPQPCVHVGQLVEIVQAHEELFPIQFLLDIQNSADAIVKKSQLQEMQRKIEHEQAFRSAVKDKIALNIAMLEFLLGRPYGFVAQSIVH